MSSLTCPGPVSRVTCRVCRRARENSGILAKLEKEKQLLRRELRDRVVQGELLRRPRGDYTPI